MAVYLRSQFHVAFIQQSSGGESCLCLMIVISRRHEISIPR